MVSSGLINRIDVSHFRLSAHLLIAFLILSLIYWNYLKIGNISNKLNIFIPLSFLILIFIQILVGAFVSGMDAGKIYNSWPLMGYSYFPDDNRINNLFEIAALSDPSLVQFIHRNLAYIIGIFYLFILFKIYKNKIYDKSGNKRKGFVYLISNRNNNKKYVGITIGSIQDRFNSHLYQASTKSNKESNYESN